MMDIAWEGPVANKLGVVRFEHKSSTIDSVYLKTGAPGWVLPTKYYQEMGERGMISDSHLLEEVKVFKRPGKMVRYSSVSYDPRYPLGERKQESSTVEVMVEDPEGYYVFRLAAGKDAFSKALRAFEHMLRTMVLAERKGESAEDVFGGLRQKKSVGDTVLLAHPACAVK